MARDYYGILGVGRNASDQEIKRAYRKLARELHPDARPDDKQAEERFKEITVAYETLSDPERRQRYDMFGPDGVKAGAAGDPFGGAGVSGLGDLFDAFFGGGGGFGTTGRGGRRSGPAQGPDAEVTAALEFEEAVFGTDKEVTLRTAVACETCDTTGAAPGTSATA
ncbi:MAG: DnaJ domain-containing protein, partial [Stackebrandtia sp.]